MADDKDKDAVKPLVFALRRIEADAEALAQKGKLSGNLQKLVETIRDGAGTLAADAAKQLKMPPYDKG
jgi:hypothetical protein